MKKPISPRSKAYRSAAQRLNCHAVCLIGFEKPHPAYFGDNRGAYPVRVATSTKEMTAADRADLDSPFSAIVVLEYVLVNSEAHAKRLKDALDEILLGQQEEKENNGLRHRFRDVRDCWDQDSGDKEASEHDRARWWSIVLAEAQRLLRPGATEFDVYDPDDVAAIIDKKAKRGF